MAPYDPNTQAPFLQGPFGLPMLGPVAFPAGRGSRPGGMPPGAMSPGMNFHPGVPFQNGAILADRFEIVDMIMEGRCGFIYLVRDRMAQQAERVLKTFDRRRGDEKDEELFRRESRLLSKLRHPRIPRGFGIIDHQGLCCATQEFVEGDELYMTVRDHGPLDEGMALQVFQQVLEVLDYLHHLSPPVLHRDIKPENLILDPSGAVWVVDFGAASDATRDKRNAKLEQITAMQTLGYAAPEQVYGLEAYPASDLYSLAVTMLYLLTAKNPIELYSGYSGRLEWEAPVSPGLRSLLDEMLRVPVSERLSSAAAALVRLE